MSQRPDHDFIEEMRALESAYLASEDPLLRSGFGGGPSRWEAERRPLTDGVDRSGSFLDVGCANGWLAFCVRKWCAESGFDIEPYGNDIGPALVADAKGLLKEAWAGDAWSWEPPRHFTFVYSLLDLAPDRLKRQWLERLAGWVEPGGRLIIGSYGSKSRSIQPVVVSAVMADAGLDVAGEAAGGIGPITRFAWTQL